MSNSLTERDLRMFSRFGVFPALLERARVCRVTDSEARERYGFTHAGDMAGIVFPYLDPATSNRVTARLRRDHSEIDSDGKPERKYVCPYGDNRHTYFAPAVGALLADTSVPAVIVEAEKSSLALAALAEAERRKMLVIATGGCWSWRGKTGITPGPNGEREQLKGLLPDLHRILWRERRATIIFDSNVSTNPNVAAAREALARELARRGAHVYFVNLPRG
jgi:hypothetical protein